MRKFVLRRSVLLAMALAFTTAVRADETLPFQMTYAGRFSTPELVSADPPIMCLTSSVSGNATYLGLYSAIFPHCINMATGEFYGTFTQHAANGDIVYIALGGFAVPMSSTVYALTFTGTFIGGTGRFVNASGTINGSGSADLATLTVSATFDGQITY